MQVEQYHIDHLPPKPCQQLTAVTHRLEHLHSFHFLQHPPQAVNQEWMIICNHDFHTLCTMGNSITIRVPPSFFCPISNRPLRYAIFERTVSNPLPFAGLSLFSTPPASPIPTPSSSTMTEISRSCSTTSTSTCAAFACLTTLVSNSCNILYRSF